MVWDKRELWWGRGVEAGTAMSSYSGVPAFQHNHILSGPLAGSSKSEYHHHRIVIYVHIGAISIHYRTWDDKNETHTLYIFYIVSAVLSLQNEGKHIAQCAVELIFAGWQLAVS